MKNLGFYTMAVAGILTSVTVWGSQPQMSEKMILRQVPAPSLDSRKDLTLYSQNPSDTIVVNQKRSLLAVAPSDQLISTERMMSLFKSELTKTMSAEAADQILQPGLKVFTNFIDGIKNHQAFDKVELSDSAQMWQMVIPNSAQVQKSILHLEWFSTGIGGHAQIRFKLNTPLLLISLDAPHEVKFIQGDIVYALMALRTEHGSKFWGPVTGLTGAFANTYMVASSAHMASIQTNTSNGSVVDQYELKLSSAQNQNLLNYALTNGERAKEHEIYNLIYNSCIQAALRAIKTVDARVDAYEFNPYEVVPDLQQLGLIKAQLPTVNQEFHSPVQSLQTTENAKNLALVQKLRPLMPSPVFSESLRLLAEVIIEDRWSEPEVNQLVTAISQLNVSQLNGDNLQSALNQLSTNVQLPAKTPASVKKLATEFFTILQRHHLEMKDLMGYLESSSLIKANN